MSVSLVPALWVIALVCAVIAVRRLRPIASLRVEQLLTIDFSSMQSLWAFASHDLPERRAPSAGRRARSKTRLASPISASGLRASMPPSPDWRGLAVAIMATGFLGGAAIGHLRHRFERNLAPGNAGPILFTDVLTPIAILSVADVATVERLPPRNAEAHRRRDVVDGNAARAPHRRTSWRRHDRHCGSPLTAGRHRRSCPPVQRESARAKSPRSEDVADISDA